MSPQELAESLIKAIKARPALYNKQDPQFHSHKKFKYDLWREVCAEVDPNWEQMTPQNQMEYQRHLQRRWKSLRDCFTRELTTQKQERAQQESGERVKLRKRYEHFKSMLFLLECSDESFKPDTEDQDEENVNLQTSSELKQEMDTDESDSSGQVKKQLFPHHLSGNLIRAIKDRPDLYKRSSNSSKIHKHNLWKEVCSEVNPSWAQMPKKRKMEYLDHLKKRWKSLRDCFSRELAKQKKDIINQEKNGGFLKERKKYEHFDEMLFLIECTYCGDSEQQDSDEESFNNEDPLETETVNLKRERVSDTDNSDDNTNQNEIVEKKPKVLKKRKKTNQKFTSEAVDDEDRQFLISLLPSFKSLNAKQKLEAKIRFLNVMKDVCFRDDNCR